MSQRIDAANRPPNHIRYGWPLHPLEWEELPVEIRGSARWQSRTLGHAARNSIPPAAGVYLMCVRPPNGPDLAEPFRGLIEIIYVGKTKDLRRRYDEHLNVPSPKVRAARNTYSNSLRFWFSIVPEGRIDLVETLLIECFGPPANDLPGSVNLLEARQSVGA